MADYIEFELNGCRLRVNPEDSYDIQRWKYKHGKFILKNPHWKTIRMSSFNDNRRHCNINKKNYTHHRIVYFAHNPEWCIDDTSAENKIDHIDGNPSNNHISNLRVATNAQNMQNQNREVKGYTFSKRKKRWIPFIRINCKTVHLGCFHTEEEAKQVRAEAVEKYYPFARQS